MILSLRRAEYSILEICLPAQKPTPFGILLLDPQSDRVYQRFRADAAPSAEDADVLALLPEDLAAKAREMGGERLLAWFEDSLSNTLRITDRRPLAVRSFENALDRLYSEHVEGTPRERGKVVPFVTHVPLYSLRAAAGLFGRDMEVEPEDWVGIPSGVRAGPEIYAVHVTGHSMEPEIPDGCIAIFRALPAGSRNGKRVLVWRRGVSGDGGEFTVKVYESVKTVTEEGWEHSRIRLKPLNPDYPVLELDDDTEYRVMGELAAVLGADEV
jgi:SOS-response transcriptional repressor LexA